jgi:hypothetical protein
MPSTRTGVRGVRNARIALGFTARLDILADLSGIADALQEIADGNTSFVQVQAVTGYNTPSISGGLQPVSGGPAWETRCW